MKKMFPRHVMLVAACAVAFLSCDTIQTGPASLGGIYAYTAYDDADSALVTGIIVLRNSTSPLLSGTWNLDTTETGGPVGPQVGSGSLAGSTEGGISINLNPQMADNNIILNGTSGRNEITGTWQWVTFSGVSAEGRFGMKKR